MRGRGDGCCLTCPSTWLPWRQSRGLWLMVTPFPKPFLPLRLELVSLHILPIGSILPSSVTRSFSGPKSNGFFLSKQDLANLGQKLHAGAGISYLQETPIPGRL